MKRSSIASHTRNGFVGGQIRGSDPLIKTILSLSLTNVHTVSVNLITDHTQLYNVARMD